MIDPAVQLLLPPLSEARGRCLWVADESSLSALPHLAPFAANLTLISHRCDIVQAAQAMGITSVLSDARWPSEPVDQCFFRIAKEKPLVYHIINQARQRLPVGGQLCLAGHKNEGIKTYADKAAKLFGTTGKAQKNGEVYLSRLSQSSGEPTQDLLDNQNYPELRPVFDLRQQAVYSKPGIYGWDKIDAGSRLLVETLREEVGPDATFASCLDLGCGYGYLTLALADYTIGRRVATDNNLAAITAMQENARRWDLEVETVVANCADAIDDKFELIVCNPPFHKVFDTQTDLTDTFLNGAKTHLTTTGKAIFVVNEFIAIEKKARQYFRNKQLLADNGQFKVLQFWQ